MLDGLELLLQRSVHSLQSELEAEREAKALPATDARCVDPVSAKMVSTVHCTAIQ